jgi:uncharacterized protein YndB with AHSA1/START domain
MANKLTSKVSIDIKAPANKVWQAVVDPKLIKEYLFGTEAKSDWKKGSTITYSGVWQGKPYTDKGVIIDIEPEKFVHSTYYSPLSGKEDKPENYNNVKTELTPKGDYTTVTISQDNINTEEELKHMEQNWGMVLDGMKKLLEK